jgi:hypothetical protein
MPVNKSDPWYRVKAGNALRGKKRYNNGVIERAFNPGDEIPEGFVLGRLPGKYHAWNKGIPQTEEHKQQQSESMKGRPTWNKGLVSPEKLEEEKELEPVDCFFSYDENDLHNNLENF